MSKNLNIWFFLSFTISLWRLYKVHALCENSQCTDPDESTEEITLLIPFEY